MGRHNPYNQLRVGQRRAHAEGNIRENNRVSITLKVLRKLIDVNSETAAKVSGFILGNDILAAETL